MIKIALLVNKLGYFYRGGVNSFSRHFQDVVNNCSNSLHCDLFAMSQKSISNNRLDRGISLFDFSVTENYDVLFLADFHLYDEDDLSILKQWSKTKKPIVSYVHGPDSIIPSNYSFIKEYVDHVFWDREKLMEDTALRYGVDIPNSHLTLPFFVSEDRRDRIDYRFNVVASQCRVASLKGIDKIINASSALEGNVVIFGYTGDRIKDRDIQYYQMISDTLKTKNNVTMFMSPYGISSSAIATLLSSCKVYLSATKYDVPGVYGVEYAAMEAMNEGCLLIADENIKQEYRNKGCEALFYDNTNDMVDCVNWALREYDSAMSKSMMDCNSLFLKNKMTLFCDQLMGVLG